MATAKPQENTECPVCHDDFVTPKFLPCTHVICRKCVLSWLSAEGQGGCPLCRAPILPTTQPEQGDVTSLVDNLPTDLATSALVESQNALNSSHVCSVCDDDVAATSYCLDCSVMLCKACTRAHGKLPATREHLLEDLSTLTAERLAASRRSPCDLHPDRPAELYCPHHQTLICLLCSSSKHRTCPGVETVGDMAVQARAALTEQVQRLKARKDAIISQIKELDQEVQDAQGHFNVSRSEVKATYDRLQNTMKKRHQKITELLQQEEKDVIAPKRAEKTTLERQMIRIVTHVGSVERLVALFADSAVVGMLDKLKARLDELESQTKPTGGVSKVPFNSFVVSDKDLTRLERELASLGQVSSKQDVSHTGALLPVDKTGTPANTSVSSASKETASDGGTGGKDEDEVLVQESDLLQKKITELKQSSTAVSDIMANLQDVREQLNEKEQFLTTHREALTTITSTPLSLSSLQQARAACGPSHLQTLKDLSRKVGILRSSLSSSSNDGQEGTQFSLMQLSTSGSAGSVAGGQTDEKIPPGYQLNMEDLEMAQPAQDIVEIVVSSEDIGSLVVPQAAASVVEIPSHTATVTLDVEEACINWISDTAIQTAAENILIMKCDWRNDRERMRQLQQEKDRLGQHLQQNRSSSCQNLLALEMGANVQLAKLYRRHEKEKKKEQEKVVTFVLQLEEKDKLLGEVLKELEKEVVKRIVQKCFDSYNIRLLGVDSELRFLMDAPADVWARVVEKQQDIKDEMADELLEYKQKVRWSNITRCDPSAADLNLRLGHPLHVREIRGAQVGCASDLIQTTYRTGSVIRDLSEDSASFNPMAASPQCVFVYKPDYGENAAITNLPKRGYPDCEIKCLITIEDSQLVLIDRGIITVVDLKNPEKVRGFFHHDAFFSDLTRLPDGLVAAASWSRNIDFVDVRNRPKIVSTKTTSKRYCGIASVFSDDTLVVSTVENGPSYVDIITRDGVVIKTVLDSMTGGPNDMWYVCVSGRHAFLSDTCAGVVCVNLDTDELVTIPGFSERTIWLCDNYSRQVCVDLHGNLYIACDDVVEVVTKDGQWRRLLKGKVHGPGERSVPWGLCITNNGILLVSWLHKGQDSVVVGYDLK